MVGACVLVTGLLSGTACAAIASADDDTGSESRTGSSQTTAEQSTGAPGSRLTDRRSGPLTKAARDAVRGITGTLDSIRKQAPQRLTVTRPLPSPPEADDTVPTGSPTDTNDSDVLTSETEFVTTNPDVLSVAPDPAQLIPLETGLSPTTLPAAPASTTPPAAPVSSATAGPTPRPSFPNLFVPAVHTVVAVTNVVTSVGTAGASVPGLLLSLPTSPTPVSDVITSLEEMLTSVAYSAVPLMQLPADFAAIFVAGWEALAVIGGYPDIGLTTSSAGLLQLLQPSQLTSTAQVFAANASTAEAAGVSALIATPLSQRFMPAGAVVDTARSTDTGAPFPKGTVTAVVISVSLLALFLAALPGLGGLAAFGATGVRIGYRQAAAGLAVRSTQLARFAPTGPIGVVRSDSLIVMRRRTPRHVPPDLRILDRAG